MSRVATLGVLGLALVAATVAPAAQGASTKDIAGYSRLVMEYIEGDADSAASAVAKLPASATKDIFEARNLGWDPQMMRAAAMLETEAAFSASNIAGIRLMNAELWLERAHKDGPPGRPDDFWRQWSLVVGRKVLWRSVFGLADPLLKRACEVFDGDAALHLAYGLARESTGFAIPPTIAFDVAMGRTPSNAWRMDALSDARTAFDRALKLNPASVEAHVRLAHVLVLLKDEPRAASLLEQTLAHGPPPLYRYLASIMLGDLQARRGQLQPAIDLYLDARRLMPTGQSSYIAHAHALRAAGQADAAAGVLSEMLARAPHDDDPWTRYPAGFDVDITQLDALRALVRKK